MKIKEKKRLTRLERKCLRRFYLDDAKILCKDRTSNFSKLGLERGMEVMFQLAEEEPIALDVVAKNYDNFIVLFSPKKSDDFEPIYVMKDGQKEF